MDRDVQLRESIPRRLRCSGEGPRRGPSRRASALVSFALLAGGLLLGCATGGPKARSPSGAHALPAVLHGRLIESEKERFVLPEGSSLTALPSLVNSLQEERAERKGLELVVRVGPRATARHLFLLLLSAGQAGIERAFVDLLDGGVVEVAVPDAEVLPPLLAADVYVAVAGEEVQLSAQLQSLARGGGPQRGSSNERAAELAALCAEERCEHAAILAHPSEPWVVLEPIVRELTRVLPSSGSVRLVLEDAGPLQQRSRAPLSHAQVKRTVEQSWELVDECKQEAVARGSVAAGTVMVRFEVSGLGLVFAAEPRAESSTITDSRLLECVAQTFLKMKFPRPDTPGLIDYLMRL